MGSEGNGNDDDDEVGLEDNEPVDVVISNALAYGNNLTASFATLLFNKSFRVMALLIPASTSFHISLLFGSLPSTIASSGTKFA